MTLVSTKDKITHYLNHLTSALPVDSQASLGWWWSPLMAKAAVNILTVLFAI